MSKVVQLKAAKYFLHISGIAVKIVSWIHDFNFIRHGHDSTTMNITHELLFMSNNCQHF